MSGSCGRPASRRTALRVATALLAGTALGACSSSSASTTPTLNFYQSKDSSGAVQKIIDTCNAAANGAYKIKYNFLPQAADGQRQELVRRLAAHDSALDIMAMDVVWAPEFAEAGWVREWTGAMKEQASQGTIPATLQTGSWQGKLYAAPWNSNTQLLWYRKDLVPSPPKTWDEMLQMSADLAKQGKPHLVEIQGAQYEGLTVWFNTMVNSEGGKILSPDGTQVVLDAAVGRALTEMKKLATGPAADPSLSQQMEDDGRLAFENGTAAFELNYPFVWASAQKSPKVKATMAYTTFPSLIPGQPAKVTIGGFDLGISQYSRHPDLAFQAALCMRSPANQKVNAITGGNPPTLESLYSDQALISGGYPFAQQILTALVNGSVRPQTPAYTNVSSDIQLALSPPKSINPSGALAKLRSGIKDALNSKGLVP